MQVELLERSRLISRYESTRPPSAVTSICSAVTRETTPLRREMIMAPESRAVRRSMPVLTSGASGRSVGTACRCILAPIRARVASSFSMNGMQAVAIEMSCTGATSIYSTFVFLIIG